jgi:MFS transporter, putative metabolite:H+ symporter
LTLQSTQSLRPTPQQITASLDRSDFTRAHLWLYLLVVLGHTFDGFDINMMGFVLPGIGAAFHVPPVAIGYLASSVFTGMLVGSIAIGTLADRIGRKWALIFSVGFYGLTSFAAAFAWNYDSLVVIRIIEGFGLGAEVPLVFTYLSEFMPRRRRGLLLASSVFFWQGASFLAALAAVVVVPAFGWRGMFVLGVLPSLVLVILFLRLPESVRFLLARGRVDEAERIARRFSTVDPAQLPVAALPPAGAEARLRDLLRFGYLRATLSIWIMQFCGGAVFAGLAVWLPSILLRMGFPVVRSFLFTAAITGAGALGNIGAGLLLDRIGRRITLAVFFLLGGVLMLAWGLAESAPAVVAIGAFTAFFGAGGAGGPLFTYTSEIYPTRFRGAGTGWAAGWQRIGGIVAPIVLGALLAVPGSSYRVFATMAASLLVGGLAVLVLGFETRGKSLEQISLELSR